MKSITFLAQFPPPIHGLSKAVETLFNSSLKEKYHFSKINITNNKQIISTLLSLWKCRGDIIYFTPSQTICGNLRDLLFFKIIQWKKKKCIVHIHGGYYRQLVDKDCNFWQRKMNYSAIKQLAGGIVLGHSLHSIFKDMLPDDKIFICPNCVDDAFIANSIDIKGKTILDTNILHILYLSNFIETKGYREVLQLAQLAHDRHDENKFIFHFAGDFFEDTEKTYFHKHIKGLNNIIYHGIVSGQAKIDLLKQCHIFILLSRYPNEGQPISILEAMGNGMAIITTDHAGIPEIASRENGFICNKCHIDINAIYTYLIDCYNNRNKLARVCLNNYQITQQTYTEKQYINTMDKIFKSICSL